MYGSRSIMALGVFVGFLDLIWARECIGESLALFLIYLFLYALILGLVARNAFICMY
jgi:hypothetical protein